MFRTPFLRLRPPLSPLRIALPRPIHSPRLNAPQLRSSSRLAEAKERLYSPHFWRYLMAEYKTTLKLALAINVGILAFQLSVHGALLKMEEQEHPTSPDWLFLPRYYLRRARMPYAWNPFGQATSDKDAKYYLDKALKEIEDELRPNPDLRNRTESWRGEFVKLLKERGGWYEKMQMWGDAKAEYARALKVEMSGEGGGRVEAASRLAKILEWEGDEIQALEVLEQAVVLAGGRVGDSVTLPPPEACTNPLLDAATELGSYLARHGQLVPALDIMTRVLVTRRTAPEPEDAREITTAVGDPCREAAAMTTVGELLFAIGKREEGLRWSEKAWEKSWQLVEYRMACKECAAVVAGNLVRMGELLADEVEEEGGKGGYWWGSKGKGGQQEEEGEARKEAERVLRKGMVAVEMVKGVRAVKDAIVVKENSRR